MWRAAVRCVSHVWGVQTHKKVCGGDLAAHRRTLHFNSVRSKRGARGERRGQSTRERESEKNMDARCVLLSFFVVLIGQLACVSPYRYANSVTFLFSKHVMSSLKPPGFSGMTTESSVSLASERSETNRSESKFILAPEAVTTKVCPKIKKERKVRLAPEAVTAKVCPQIKREGKTSDWHRRRSRQKSGHKEEEEEGTGAGQILCR